MAYRTQFAFRKGAVTWGRTTDLDKILRQVDDPQSDFYHWTIVSRDDDNDAWSVDPDLNYT